MSTQQAREADVTGQVETRAPKTEGAGESRASDPILTVAVGLADHGLEVHGPEQDESYYLKITNSPGTMCDVLISEDGSAEWEYRLSRLRYTDPAVIADIALRVLGVNTTQPQAGLPQRYPKRTLISVAGQALVSRGMQVCLEVYKDDCFFEVSSEIEVTNPALPSRGAVRIADDNSIRWECSFVDPDADIDGIDPLDFAETIVKVLTA
jgi:hypothetical protein